MNCPNIVGEIDIDSFERALHLLERFFAEEGFGTPPEKMRSALSTMITSPAGAVFLAWRDDEAVGVATVTTSVGLEYGLSAEIDDLYVLPEARGRGVAGALIEAACDWCRQRGVSAVLVTVTPEGDAEHDLSGFYRHHGFTNRGRVILERALGADG